MTGGRTYSMSASDEPSVSVTDLALMVDEALALLDRRFPAAPQDQARSVSPLPSILDRCEALLQRAEGPAPLRAVLTFSVPGPGHLETMLTRLPNVQLVTNQMLSLSNGSAGAAPAMAKTPNVSKAAFDALDQRLRLTGKYPVVLLSHLGQQGHGERISLSDLVDADPKTRPVIAVIYACHPLRSWLVARQNGWLPIAPMPLETYAEHYLAFLKDHTALPILTQGVTFQDTASALTQLARQLDLPFGKGVVEDLSGLPYASSVAGTLPRFHYDDGSIAVDEPLDTPHYQNLCDMLGFDPHVLPKDDHQTSEGPHASMPLVRPLPAFDGGRGSARLAGILPQIAAITDRTHPEPSTGFVLTTARVVELIESCLSHPDGFYEHLDEICSGLSPADAALLLIASAGHYVGIGENIHGLALLAEAEALIPADCRPLQRLAAELFLRMRRPGPALRLLLSDALGGSNPLPDTQRSLLEESIAPLIASTTNEHGHALLIDYLQSHRPAKIARRRVMIEIGTTREQVPGQGSTEKLARLCDALGLDFITVDMDPRNSAVARRLFRRLNLPFQAVTAKGEDFLAGWQGEIDYCFLDAYDFDHGQHSELRQSRYESFLGSRIEDEQCHKMHLDCATSLVAKMAADGVICFDDTWTDTDGAWTAKGTTAMPYLLSHGFKVETARNRAALLRRR